ncbi:MAG: hypothetical protein N2203_02860, partial [Bacteroidia bacterium]|nr:hypothetical protein [Bacteroidia bacterium]
MKKIILSFLFTCSVALFSYPQSTIQKSVIQEHSELFRQFHFTNENQWDSVRSVVFKIPLKLNLKTTNASTLNPSCNLNKRVFGWFPYWQGSTYTNFQWNLLSDFCYFDYTVNPNNGNNSNSSYAWLTSNAVTT